MNCIVAYGALTLTAYVYRAFRPILFPCDSAPLTRVRAVPFGGFIVPKIVSHIKAYGGDDNDAFLSTLDKQSFSIHPGRLRNTVRPARGTLRLRLQG
jgi:hypothetical protein